MTQYLINVYFHIIFGLQTRFHGILIIFLFLSLQCYYVKGRRLETDAMEI